MTNGNPTPWKYTDDIIAIAVIGVWLAGKIVGFVVPDEIAVLAMGYVFGSNLPQR
jgi:hypothetical protein